MTAQRTAEQCQRLALEKKLIERYMPGFHVINPSGNTYIEGWAYPKGGSSYMLRLDLPISYPYSKPLLFIVNPQILRMHNSNESINSLGTSHRFHTHENGPNGCVQICHSRSWNPSETCVKVLLKGHLWCEAYSAHLRTGECIADYVSS